MRILIYALAITLGSFFVSCKKKAADVSPDYVGYWMAYDSYEGGTLEIDSDSKAVYEVNSAVTSTTVKGKARVKGNTLKILFKKFTINQKPKEQPSSSPYRYSMILDGVTYVKY